MIKPTLEEVRQKAEEIIDRAYDSQLPGDSDGYQVAFALRELLAFIDGKEEK